MRLATVDVDGAAHPALIDGDGSGELARLLSVPDSWRVSPAGRRWSATRGLISRMGCDWQALSQAEVATECRLEDTQLLAPIADPSFFGEVDRTTYFDVEIDHAAAGVASFYPVRPVPDSAISGCGGVFAPASLTGGISVTAGLAAVVAAPVDAPVDGELGVLGITLMIACRNIALSRVIHAPFEYGDRDNGCALLWLSRWNDGSHALGPWLAPPAALADQIELGLVVDGLARHRVPIELDELHAAIAQLQSHFPLLPGDVVGLNWGGAVEVSEPPAERMQLLVEAPELGALALTLDAERWRSGRPYVPRFRRPFADAIRRRAESGPKPA